MKSIMEEASSIVKAIEKGWLKAGQPKEFSVKIFEEPQKNFIGMTIRSAKIGIFFEDTAPAKTQEQPSKQKTASHTSRDIAKTQHVQKPKENKQPARQPKERVQQKPVVQEKNLVQDKPEASTEEPKYTHPVWTDAMVAHCQELLTQTLSLMGKSDIHFTIEPQHFHLKIQFNNPIVEDKGREKQFFASLSTLLLQMLKHHYRRPLKGYKIILIGS